MRLMKQNNSLEDATRRAQAQIQAVRHRAQKELERATKQATRALQKSNSEQKYSILLGAIIGTAALGGAAAWLMNRRRSS